MFDFNKSVLDHIFAKKSDYLVLDILDARHPMLIKGNHYITMTKKLRNMEPLISEHLGMNDYEEKSPFTDISIKQWEDCISRLADEMCRHYTVDQIILNVHYGVKQYVSESGIKNFSASVADNVREYNALVKSLFDMLRTALEGCHIIEFPDHVVAVTGHRWGLGELHYHDIYYDYGAEAIKVILRGLSDEEEKVQLECLRISCSEKFELLRAKKELNMIQRKLKQSRNALNFTEMHANDFYGDEKFSKWLSECRAENKKIVVLKCGCVAGKILLKGLKKYEVDILFSTEDEGFNRLSEEQFNLCKKADIVVSANVHSAILPERDGIKAVSVYDILR